MSKTQAAKKGARQNEARRLSNREKLSEIKTARKKFLESLKIGKEVSIETFQKAQSLLAKAVKKGRMHWKTGARLVSRMSKKLNNSK